MRRSFVRRLAKAKFVVVAPLWAAFTIVVFADPSRATNCADVCPGSGACTISTTVDVDPGSEMDCAGRDVTVSGTGTLKVTDGDFILIAEDIVIDGLVHAVEGVDEIPGSIDLDATGSITIAGKVRANGNSGGGTIALLSGSNILIPENGTDGIEADGTAAGASGGEITLEAAGSITIYDPIHVDGASGGDNQGGTIEITAHGDILTAQHGHLSAVGKVSGGGRIRIVSETGDVLLNEHVDVDGKGSVGDGGAVEVVAADRLEVGLGITARGGVNAGGGQAVGGSVHLEGGCGGVAILASISAVGGQLGTGFDGGEIVVDSGGDITVASGVVLDVHALATSGDGGSVELDARDLVSIAGGATLDVRGSTTAPGRGGSIRVAGCRVSVQSAAVLDATGATGGNVFAAARLVPPATGTQPLFVSRLGTLRAAGASQATNGRIQLAPLHLRKGTCSNDANLTCVLDTDCTVGCQTGDCLLANPDIEGVVTQFDLVPGQFENRQLGTCPATCEQ